MSVISWRAEQGVRGGSAVPRSRAASGRRHLSGDAAVFVEVVQVEGPVQLVSDGAS